MDDLEKRILLAQEDSGEIDNLLDDYFPFIKKQLTNVQTLGLEHDDMLSLAMMTFVGCVKQYKENVGGFLSFASVSIKNRLIDESRKQRKHHSKRVFIRVDEDEKVESATSLAQYNKEEERRTLEIEINALSEELQPFGVRFSELPKICPKQERSRKLCIWAAQELVRDSGMKTKFVKNRVISKTELAKRLDISEKTIEKHRKYIAMICVLLLGDFPNIKAFLPRFEGVQV